MTESINTASEAALEWKVKAALSKGWWAAGYIYRGEPGSHQGQFVTVELWPTVDAAKIYTAAMKVGYSRREAREQAKQR